MTSFDFTYLPSRGPSRSEAARQGREAVAIVEAGGYVAPSGARVDLGSAIARAVASSRDYPPELVLGTTEPARSSARGVGSTRFDVVNGTSLSVARAMASRGVRPLVLNFASAKNPGGGFLNGARAQEESLARSSALYPTLLESAMYARHRELRDPLYTTFVVTAQDVPVFRDDDTGELLDEPYLASFVTSPAPNAGVVLARDPGRLAEVEQAMRERVRRVLDVARLEGHRALVLGAWGCGVFGNEPRFVAEAFATELFGDFTRTFDEVVFAVLDWSEERRFVRPFAERFAS
jgi:uncharacterized protein (TIGR02452 family)